MKNKPIISEFAEIEKLGRMKAGFPGFYSQNGEYIDTINLYHECHMACQLIDELSRELGISPINRLISKKSTHNREGA